MACLWHVRVKQANRGKIDRGGKSTVLSHTCSIYTFICYIIFDSIFDTIYLILFMILYITSYYILYYILYILL